MFSRLDQPPRLPVEAELLPGQLLRITTERNGGKRQATEYAVEIGDGDDVIAEQLILWGGGEGRANTVSVMHTGEANCTCEAFTFERCGETRRACKHVAACIQTGLITSIELPQTNHHYAESRP